MKISFPIATFNRTKILLERTLPSILNQKYVDIEVIIVGDNVDSKDWRNLVEKINDSRVRLYNLKKRTAYPENPFHKWCIAGYRPRNIASRLATGDWHWWISDDDEVAPNAIEKLVEFIKIMPSAESIYGNYIIEKKNEIIEMNLSNSNNGLPFEITGMPAWIVKSTLSRKYKWSGYSYQNLFNKPSDYDLQMRMHLGGVIFKYFDEVIAVNHLALPDKNLTGSRAYELFPEYF